MEEVHENEGRIDYDAKIVKAFKEGCLKPALDAKEAISRLFTTYMESPSVASSIGGNFSSNFEAVVSILINLEAFISTCRSDDA